MKKSLQREIIASNMEKTNIDLQKLIEQKTGKLLSLSYIRVMKSRENKDETPKNLITKKLAENKRKDEEKNNKKMLEHLMKENVRLENDLGNILQLKNGVQEYILSKKVASKGEVVPIILASDWHIEELVKPETVNGLNSYTLEIADKRIKTFFQNSVRLVKREMVDSKVDTVILALLGDFISGAIHEPLLPICQVQPMDAIIRVQNHLISGIKFMLAELKIKKLLIPCTVGNHSRISPKVWIATENGFSLEYLMYNAIKGVFQDEPRVEFQISASQHCYVDVWNYKLRFLHGTQIRYSGGLGGFTIPGNKKVNMWNTPIPAYYTFMGHLHQLFDSNPKFLVNGSLIGYNTFALSIGAEYQKPCQAIIFLSKKHGKCGVNPIYVE